MIEGDKVNNRIGIYFAYWTQEWDGDFIYYVKKAAGLGFDTLEICPANLIGKPRSVLRDIRKVADDSGIDLTYCIGIPPEYDIASEDKHVAEAGVIYQKRLIDVVSDMGGELIGGILYSCWPGSFSFGISDKRPWWERSVSNMKMIAEYAEEKGVTLCMEVVNRFEQILLNTAEEGVAYCRDVDNPACRLLLDTYHMNIEEDSFRDAILTAKDYLHHFHAGETNRKTPGLGKLDWDTVCGTLNEIGYTGHVVMEPFVRMGGTVGGDIKVWRDLSGNADEGGLDKMAREACRFIKDKMDHVRGGD